jgi:hypothetical protein
LKFSWFLFACRLFSSTSSSPLEGFPFSNSYPLLARSLPEILPPLGRSSARTGIKHITADARHVYRYL